MKILSKDNYFINANDIFCLTKASGTFFLSFGVKIKPL